MSPILVNHGTLIKKMNNQLRESVSIGAMRTISCRFIALLLESFVTRRPIWFNLENNSQEISINP